MWALLLPSHVKAQCLSHQNGRPATTPEHMKSCEETSFAASDRIDLFFSSAESTIAYILEAMHSICNSVNAPSAFSPWSSLLNYSPINAKNMSISPNTSTLPTENVTFAAHLTAKLTTNWGLHIGKTSPAMIWCLHLIPVISGLVLLPKANRSSCNICDFLFDSGSAVALVTATKYGMYDNKIVKRDVTLADGSLVPVHGQANASACKWQSWALSLSSYGGSTGLPVLKRHCLVYQHAIVHHIRNSVSFFQDRISLPTWESFPLLPANGGPFLATFGDEDGTVCRPVLFRPDNPYRRELWKS